MFHGSNLRGGGRSFTPDAGKGGLDLLLEAGDQFAVGSYERLLGFDFGDDGLLLGEGWSSKLRQEFTTKFSSQATTALPTLSILTKA